MKKTQLSKILMSTGITLEEVINHADAMDIEVNDSQLEDIVCLLSENESIFDAKEEALNEVIQEVTDKKPDLTKASEDS